ncbi:hypothetical protein FisN_4Lh079 [Fistulifera solaris]|uniref:Peptidase S1 domain-containing protein n=1 Tax=Fistulifera solaris TaxID=1519565 RepID=A0A1Z5JZN9_FISSO|nr:hypothetical protein FisN_4Lh079 [Fistulifera solaris]|eukprot:GAX19342.1 hypothetical protein FisN_4Lh079 [Fistulifera solaris]
MIRSALLLLAALLRPCPASRRLQPLARGGDGQESAEDIRVSYLESNGSNSNTTTSLYQNTSIVREGTVKAQSTKYDESFADDNVLERAEPTVTPNGGGATIRRSGNATFDGKSIVNNTEQIVGGTATAFGSFPFFVHGANPNDDRKICGGVLVHPDIFLTAASCRTLFFEDSEVFIGATNLLSTLGFAESRKILEKKAHPDYDFVSRANDLMLIKLDSASTQTPADFNRVADFPVTGESLVVVGFGWTNVAEEVLSQSLQQATITVADFARCEATNNAAVSAETQICAGQPTGGPDSCDFDTGGPVLTQDGGFLHGINSFAVGCGFPDSEGVYTRVSAFQAFIEDGICELSTDPPAFCLEDPTTTPTVVGNIPAPALTPAPTLAAPQSGQTVSPFSPLSPISPVSPVSTPTLSFSPTIPSAPTAFATKSPTRREPGKDKDNEWKWKGRRKRQGKGEGYKKGKRGSGKKSSKSGSGKKSSKKSSWSDRSSVKYWYRYAIFKSVKGQYRYEQRTNGQKVQRNIFQMDRTLGR